jgi:hypothetical protein
LELTDLGSIHFRNSDLSAGAMAKYSHNTGANKIEMLVFNSDSEE